MFVSVIVFALGMGPGAAKSPTASSSAPGTISTVPVELEGDAERARDVVAEQLRQGLGRGALEFIDRSSGAVPEPCVHPECERSVAADDEADFIVRARVSARDNVFVVHLQASDAAGDIIASTEDVCEICGLQELGELTAARAAALSEQLESIRRAPPIARFASSPTKAGVWLDGEFIGHTPFEYELSPGEHELVFEAEGYIPQTRTVSLAAGVREEVSVILGEAKRDRRARSFVVGGGTGLGLGVAMLGAGIPLIALDSRPFRAQCNPDAEGNCERLHDSLAVGSALAAIGTAAAVTGAALLGVGLSRRKREKVDLAVSSSGIGVRF